MPECTAARTDRVSSALARLALSLAVMLFACGWGAWILRACVPGWVWGCVWPDTLALALWLLLAAAPRRDPRLAPRRAA